VDDLREMVESTGSAHCSAISSLASSGGFDFVTTSDDPRMMLPSRKL
jgi:hypothetical protein